MLGDTLPRWLCREETERGFYTHIYDYTITVDVSRKHRYGWWLHHHQDVIVQKEKGVGWVVQLQLHDPTQSYHQG
jgi:hypothetical protein